MNPLEKILLKKWEQKKWSHFYLLNASQKEKLQSWVQELLISVIHKIQPSQQKQSIKNQILQGSIQDVLFVTPKQDGDYQSEDFSEFYSFLHYQPTQLNHKFAIVNDVWKIPTGLINKLLLSLEDPGKKMSIFFLNPGSQKLLPTLESRAIKLSLFEQGENDSSTSEWHDDKNFDQASPESQQVTSILKDLNQEKISISMAMEKLKNLQNDHLIMQYLLDWERTHQSDYSRKDQTLKFFQWFFEAKNFHNSPLERLHSFLHLIDSKHHASRPY